MLRGFFIHTFIIKNGTRVVSAEPLLCGTKVFTRALIFGERERHEMPTIKTLVFRYLPN